MMDGGYYKEIVLRNIAGVYGLAKRGKATYSVGDRLVHVRYKSPSANMRFPFNISRTTLKADYELWICGNEKTYYFIPIEIIKNMYYDPDAYHDKRHPNLTVITCSTSDDRVIYAKDGKSINIGQYRNVILRHKIG